MLNVARASPQALLTVGLAAIVCTVAFTSDGGLQLARTTPAVVALIVGGGATVAGALLLAPRRARLWGSGPLLALLAFAALSALSIVWAANPSEAWIDANRLLACCAVFAAAAALAHSVPHRWGAVIGAITLSAVVLSAYAIATLIAPAALNPNEVYARLSEPFDYWNSVGLAAALGMPGCLWLGARRSGNQALGALAHPALGVLVLALLLSYSRGALVAAVVGVAFWLAIVPLRLRAAAVLISGAGGGGLVAAWAFSQGALADDRVPLELREQAGVQLGLLVAFVLAVLALTGLLVGFVRGAYPPTRRRRRRIGIVLALALALVPVGLAVALEGGEQGFADSIASRWEQLTDPTAPALPRNDASRLTAAGSVRAQYWDEALKVYGEHKLLGVGAGGYATVRKRFRSTDGAVRHAHGFVVQTLADLGLVGLALSLALLAAWLTSAARATGLRLRARSRSFSDERIGLLTLVAVVLAFGASSFVDWTWIVPAHFGVALLAAGWVAGRGPLRDGDGDLRRSGSRVERLRAGLRERPRAVCAAAAVALALAGAWSAWQPLRADSIGQDALDTLAATGDADAARRLAAQARARNPLAVDPLFELATIEAAAGRKNEARRALEQAVRLQPANPDPWLRLAQFELGTLRRPKVALTAIRPALFLDPRSADAVAVFLAAQRQATAP